MCIRDRPYDELGDGLGVLENIFDDNTTVVNWYETQTWQDLVKRMWDWNKKGLIMPDATSNTDSSVTTIGAVGFSTFGHFKPGVMNQASAEAGTELVNAQLYPAVSTTNMVNASYCIPASCEKPEKAMQVLELLYNDPEIANLFANGMEGEHWVYTDKMCIRDRYNNAETCPEELLLFFHHVLYTYRLKTGKTVIQHIYDSHFEGVEEVEGMIESWKRLEGKVDDKVFSAVMQRFDRQLDNAREWRDQVNTYFYRKSGIPDQKGRKIF